MEALEAIHTRRSIRKYQDKPVPDELIQRILAAAMSAPSANNTQPWHFVVITDREVLAQIPKVNPNATMATDAPLAILVCGDVTLAMAPGYWVVDCSAAVENLLLAAHAVGLGAVWMTGPMQAKREIEKALKVPPEMDVVAFIPVGYPAETPVSRGRKPVTEVSEIVR